MTEPIHRGIAVVRDAATPGSSGPALELSFPSQRTTVRAAIRQRVLHGGPRPPGSVYAAASSPGGSPSHPAAAPSSAESSLAAAGSGAEQRVAAAYRAFEGNGLLVLVGERQVTGLDEEIDLSAGEEITFLALVPLAGG